MRGAADVQTDPSTPAGCLAVLGTTYCAEDSSPIGKILIASRLAGHAAIRERFERASAEGDLPANADPHELTHYIGTVVCGVAVLAASGANTGRARTGHRAHDARVADLGLVEELAQSATAQSATPGSS